MRASKENAQKAIDYLSVRRMRSGSSLITLSEEATNHVDEFLQAALAKLPREKSFIKDAQRKRRAS